MGGINVHVYHRYVGALRMLHTANTPFWVIDSVPLHQPAYLARGIGSTGHNNTTMLTLRTSRLLTHSATALLAPLLTAVIINNRNTTVVRESGPMVRFGIFNLRLTRHGDAVQNNERVNERYTDEQKHASVQKVHLLQCDYPAKSLHPATPTTRSSDQSSHKATVNCPWPRSPTTPYY